MPHWSDQMMLAEMPTSVTRPSHPQMPAPREGAHHSNTVEMTMPLQNTMLPGMGEDLPPAAPPPVSRTMLPGMGQEVDQMAPAPAPATMLPGMGFLENVGPTQKMALAAIGALTLYWFLTRDKAAPATVRATTKRRRPRRRVRVTGKA